MPASGYHKSHITQRQFLLTTGRKETCKPLRNIAGMALAALGGTAYKPVKCAFELEGL